MLNGAPGRAVVFAQVETAMRAGAPVLVEREVLYAQRHAVRAIHRGLHIAFVPTESCSGARLQVCPASCVIHSEISPLVGSPPEVAWTGNAHVYAVDGSCGEGMTAEVVAVGSSGSGTCSNAPVVNRPGVGVCVGAGVSRRVICGGSVKFVGEGRRSQRRSPPAPRSMRAPACHVWRGVSSSQGARTL